MVGFSFVPGEPRRYTATVENALAQSSGLRKTFHMAKSKEISDAIDDCLKGIAAFFREHRDEIAVAGRMFLDGSIVNHICQPLADVGWHLNFRSPLRAIVVDDQIDEKMKNHLTLDWEELLNSLTEHFPQRKRFIERAAERHLAEDYISSVPLFITQIDGICHDTFGASYFSNFGEMRHQIEGAEPKENVIKQAVFDSLKNKPKMLTASSNETAPKRDGIMHGSAQFLDYDDEISSLKAFSLLCFLNTCINH